MKVCFICSSSLNLTNLKMQTYFGYTDATNSAIGVVLSRTEDWKEKLIAYASKNKFTNHEEANVLYERNSWELTIILNTLRITWLIKFTLRTDHKAIVWLMKWKKSSTSQYCLWKADLGYSSSDMEHRKGWNHGNADASNVNKVILNQGMPECKIDWWSILNRNSCWRGYGTGNEYRWKDVYVSKSDDLINQDAKIAKSWMEVEMMEWNG